MVEPSKARKYTINQVLFTVVSWLPVPIVYQVAGSVATTVNKTTTILSSHVVVVVVVVS